MVRDVKTTRLLLCWWLYLIMTLSIYGRHAVNVYTYLRRVDEAVYQAGARRKQLRLKLKISQPADTSHL